MLTMCAGKRNSEIHVGQYKLSVYFYSINEHDAVSHKGYVSTVDQLIVRRVQQQAETVLSYEAYRTIFTLEMSTLRCFTVSQ